jgi:hypothetical protein
MASSKTKIAQELTPDELTAFCESLRDVPHGEMAAKIIELAQAQGISIGRSAAYEFKNKEMLPWLKRLQLRKEKAAAINEMGDDDSGRTLADAAAAELGQIAFDMVSELDGQIDIQTEEGQAIFKELTNGIHRLRTGDRAMIKQQAERIKELEAQQKAAEAILDSTKGKGGVSGESIAMIRKALGMAA